MVAIIPLWSRCCRSGNTVSVNVLAYPVPVKDGRLRELPNHVADLVRLAMTAPAVIAVQWGERCRGGSMRIANLAGRAVLLVADGAIDINKASGGALGP